MGNGEWGMGSGEWGIRREKQGRGGRRRELLKREI